MDEANNSEMVVDPNFSDGSEVQLVEVQVPDSFSTMYGCDIGANQYLMSLEDYKPQRREHRQKPFTCPECQAKFMQASNLKRHIRTHNGEKPYTCSVCERSFAQKNNLTSHMRTHTGERPFACPQCDQRFTQQSNLKKHLRHHLNPGERPPRRYTCAECEKKFADYSILKAHLRIHTGERPFACTFCDKQFTQESNLRRHIRIHTGDKPFVCPQCNKSFSQNNNLKAHMVVHSGHRPYKCSMCSMEFARSASLQQHMKTHVKAHMKSDFSQFNEDDSIALSQGVPIEVYILAQGPDGEMITTPEGMVSIMPEYTEGECVEVKEEMDDYNIETRQELTYINEEEPVIMDMAN